MNILIQLFLCTHLSESDSIWFVWFTTQSGRAETRSRCRRSITITYYKLYTNYNIVLVHTEKAKWVWLCEKNFNVQMNIQSFDHIRTKGDTRIWRPLNCGFGLAPKICCGTKQLETLSGRRWKKFTVDFFWKQNQFEIRLWLWIDSHDVLKRVI